MKMPFVIDGNNLFWSVRDVPDVAEHNSDFQLCRLIGRYLRLVGETGQIIFDGAGPADKRGFESIENLDVFFAGAGRDADTAIEGKIKASSGARELVIVSSDRRLRRAARASGASAVKSEDFWVQLQKELKRKKTTKEPDGKRHGLTESETKQWLRFLGLDE
jgi:predicted RNA-binding protein with PIN domain